MLFFWRKNKQIDTFANELADELFSQVPPNLFNQHQSGKSKKATKQFEKELQNTTLRLAQFTALNKLGVYGKSRLQMTFMERLRSHGYAEDMVKDLNQFLLMRTSKR